MKMKVPIYKAKNYVGDLVIGQLLVIENTPVIIRFKEQFEDPDLCFDGHHISQYYDSPLWVQPDSVEFLFEKEVEVR